MKVTILYRRNRLSPIRQSTEGEPGKKNILRTPSLPTPVGGRVINLPVVLASTTRGKTRTFVATRLLRDLVSAGEVSTPAQIGTAVNLIKQGNLNAKQGQVDPEFTQMVRENPFLKTFGYMSVFTFTDTAGMSVSPVYPIVGHEKDPFWSRVSSLARERGLAVVNESEITERVVDLGGGTVITHTFPLTIFIPSAPRSLREYYAFMLKAVEGEVNAEKIAELENEIKKFFQEGSEKGSADRALKGNIVYLEIFTPVADLVQEIRFREVPEEYARAVLYALRESVVSGVPSADMIAEGKASNKTPGLGGMRSQGFGFIEEVVFVGEDGKEIEPTKEDYEKFIEDSLKTLPDIIKKAVELVGGR